MKEGFLMKGEDQKRKNWKQKWIVLTNGALYYYQKKAKTFGVVELKAVELDINPTDLKTDKLNIMCLTFKGTNKKMVFSAQNDHELNEWVALIKPQLDKEALALPSTALASIPSLKGKGAKYAIQSSVATSMIGRKLIREVVHEDSWKALDAFAGFLRKAQGDEVADRFRKDLVRIGTKLALLHNNRLITDDAVVKMGKIVRKISQTLVDYYQMPSIFDAATLISILDELKKAVEPHLEAKVSPKSMEKFRNLFAVVCSEELLVSFFEKQKWSELEELATIVRKHITTRKKV